MILGIPNWAVGLVVLLVVVVVLVAAVSAVSEEGGLALALEALELLD